MDFPGNLRQAVGQLVEGAQDLRLASEALSTAYREGRDSGAVNLAAYLATRVPATFAANIRVLDEVMALRPAFAPQSLLDVGAGPGTASWAALSHWPDIERIIQLEKLALFRKLAEDLNRQSELPALLNAVVSPGNIMKADARHRSELVVASYVLAELPLLDMAAAARQLWDLTEQVLVIIEPGTPAGFARQRLVRDALIRIGAQVVAPCTHAQACPMAGNDWCHFKVRVQRSRAHMHAKNAIVPFEDEAFSYLVVQRGVLARSGGRVISPVVINKIEAAFSLCSETGLNQTTVASRNKPAYKRAKKIVWGDLWE